MTTECQIAYLELAEGMVQYNYCKNHKIDIYMGCLYQIIGPENSTIMVYSFKAFLSIFKLKILLFASSSHFLQSPRIFTLDREHPFENI